MPGGVHTDDLSPNEDEKKNRATKDALCEQITAGGKRLANACDNLDSVVQEEINRIGKRRLIRWPSTRQTNGLPCERAAAEYRALITSLEG